MLFQNVEIWKQVPFCQIDARSRSIPAIDNNFIWFSFFSWIVWWKFEGTWYEKSARGTPYKNDGGERRIFKNLPVPSFRSGIYFFFFVVASNLKINLCIKLCSLLEGIYYSDCLQQKRPNQNPLSARISRGRGPTHPFLCDVKWSFDLFIKPG